MKLIIAALVLICGICDYACADNLIVGQYSYHFKKYMYAGGPEFRDKHALIGYSTENYTFIAMKNSFDKNSLVALRTFHKDFNSNFRGYASIGVATGYSKYIDESVGDLSPVGYFNLDIHPRSNRFGLVVTYAPDVFVGVGVRLKIGN